MSAGRDSPNGNGATEEAEEPMAVPEDLSANSIHQQNNRADKGMRQGPHNQPRTPLTQVLLTKDLITTLACPKK